MIKTAHAVAALRILIGVVLTIPVLQVLFIATVIYLSAKWLKKPTIERYAFNILVAVDQLENTLFGGDMDETLSSRAAKSRDKLGWKQLGIILEWIDPGHLDWAIEKDEGKDEIDFS